MYKEAQERPSVGVPQQTKGEYEVCLRGGEQREYCDCR